MTGEQWITALRRRFGAAKDVAERAVARLDDDEFFARPAPGSNSIAIIMKHVAGNLRSRWTDFLLADGEKPDRDRDGEFIIAAADSRGSITAAWDDGWQRLFDTLDGLGAADLGRTVHVRGEALLAGDALLWQLAHHAGHSAQIVQLAKLLKGDAWESLSIPLNRERQGIR